MDSPPLLHSVESWIWPLGIAEFREQHWLRRPFVRERGASAVGVYSGIGPSGPDDDEWLYSLGGSPHVPIAANGELASTASMSITEASKFFRAGYTVWVADAEPLIPSAKALVRTFDLPPSHVSCNVYLSKPGCYTPPHFDATDTFVFQLRGVKVWRIAENRAAPMPLTHTGLKRPVPSSIRSYAPGEWPTGMPGDAREIIATPGTVMYLPRGYWHTTETRQESVSAHIHYRTLSWVDMVQVAIRRELVRHPEWREAAFGLGENVEERRNAERKLAPLLSRIAADIAGLRVSDVLGPRERGIESSKDRHFSVRYRRVGAAAAGIESVAADGTRTMRFTVANALTEQATEFELPEMFANACLWICRQPLNRHFGVNDLAGLGLSSAEAKEIFAQLAEAGVIESADDSP